MQLGGGRGVDLLLVHHLNLPDTHRWIRHVLFQYASCLRIELHAIVTTLLLPTIARKMLTQCNVM
jgi:hypothetical protein